jgi:hypothetical protein
VFKVVLDPIFCHSLRSVHECTSPRFLCFVGPVPCPRNVWIFREESWISPPLWPNPWIIITTTTTIIIIIIQKKYSWFSSLSLQSIKLEVLVRRWVLEMKNRYREILNCTYSWYSLNFYIVIEKIVPAKWIICDKCSLSDKTAEITAVPISCSGDF